jgi:hypothetical protein
VIPAPPVARRRGVLGKPGRPVVCIRPDGTESRYSSITEAAKATGENPSGIYAKCTRGRFRQPRARLRIRFADGGVS